MRLKDGRIEPARFGDLPGTPPADAVALDPKGRLWVVTHEGLFVQEEGLQFRVLAPRPPGLNLTLAAGTKGAMYLGTKAGITTFLPDGTRKDWGPAQGLPADGVGSQMDEGLLMAPGPLGYFRSRERSRAAFLEATRFR